MDFKGKTAFVQGINTCTFSPADVSALSFVAPILLSRQFFFALSLVVLQEQAIAKLFF